MANLYYREDLRDGDFEPGATLEVVGEEARHAVRVSRLRVGERTVVGNGDGALGFGEVSMVDRDRFAVRLDRVERRAAPECRLVLVQALAKGDRDERAVEQATEFGVDRILPWEARRSVSRWGAEKAGRGVAKWQRIAREAAKQSMRARIPEVGAAVQLRELLAATAEPAVETLVLHPRAELRLSEWARTGVEAGTQELRLVIGPEGGFDDEEISALEAAGARVLLLGDTVLRTSSAGPAGIAVLNAALGRW